MTPPANTERYTHHRFPGEIISPGVWLYYGIVIYNTSDSFGLLGEWH